MIPPRLSAPDLRKLALDVHEGRVFCSLQGEDAINAFRLVFLLTGKPESTETWGMLYEDMDKANPRSMNGMPAFTSFKVLHVDDVNPFLDAFKEAAQMREKFLAGGV